MQTSQTIGILVVSILIFITAISFILLQKTDFSPSNSQLVECNTLSYENEKAINIILFADKKTSENYKNEFFKISPLKENQEKFNFYYISEYIPECELYKNIAVFCYSKELLKKASSCPNDFIIIPNNNYSQSTRSSSYMNVLSLNTKHQPSVLHHEFGHAFANLAEEYAPAKIPRGSENCVLSCEDFNNLNEGCFQTCSQSNYYRSIDSGIMRTLSSNAYGNFNSILISEKISYLTGSSNYPAITSKAISQEGECKNNFYVLLTLSPTFKVLKKEIISGCVTGTGSGNLEYSIISNSGSEISQDFDLTIFTDVQLESEIELTGEVYESDLEFYLPVPIIESSQTLKIKDKITSQEISSIELNDLDSRPCRK